MIASHFVHTRVTTIRDTSLLPKLFIQHQAYSISAQACCFPNNLSAPDLFNSKSYTPTHIIPFIYFEFIRFEPICFELTCIKLIYFDRCNYIYNSVAILLIINSFLGTKGRPSYPMASHFEESQHTKNRIRFHLTLLTKKHSPRDYLIMDKSTPTMNLFDKDNHFRDSQYTNESSLLLVNQSLPQIINQQLYVE